ncbi:MAG TPA: hypothetical protein DCE41_33000 [Cytophagales bacterium]|nr:hypothetical protein [Cytophagales bacterium]HAA17700.1 hypothetical protein [Cytophagales bacterium]HAP62492.1 hypothetical protein [Cytophagales bacterium]
MSSVGQELLNAPFPELVKDLGVGIADAQYALDQVSIKITQLMAGYKENEDTGKLEQDDNSFIQLKEGGTKYSLLALGFTPTFYQFVDTVIELKMSVSMTRSSETSVQAKARALFVASVNASYSQKFQYSVEGSSLMRTKLVTVPAPTVLEARIQDELGGGAIVEPAP